jgi:hypothetical protein
MPGIAAGPLRPDHPPSGRARGRLKTEKGSRCASHRPRWTCCGNRAPLASATAVVRRLARRVPSHIGGDERRAGRPAAGWPWGPKGRGRRGRAVCGEARLAGPNHAGGQPGGLRRLRGDRCRWAGRAGRAGRVPRRQRAARLAAPADAVRPVPGGAGGAAGLRGRRAGVASLAAGRRAGAGGALKARPGAGSQSCWCSGSGPGRRCPTRSCAGCRTAG